jgi:hypothetical protein
VFSGLARCWVHSHQAEEASPRYVRGHRRLPRREEPPAHITDTCLHLTHLDIRQADMQNDMYRPLKSGPFNRQT